MAFVFKSEREDPVKPTNSGVGPGTYLGISQSTPELSNAPFLCKIILAFFWEEYEAMGLREEFRIKFYS